MLELFVDDRGFYVFMFILALIRSFENNFGEKQKPAGVFKSV